MMIGKPNGAVGVPTGVGGGVDILKRSAAWNNGTVVTMSGFRGMSSGPLGGSSSGARSLSMDHHASSSNSNSPPNLPPVMPLIHENEAVVALDPQKMPLLEFQQQLMAMKQEQQMEQQMLLQSYQQRQRQLAEAHERQLRERVRLYMESQQQQQLEQEQKEAQQKCRADLERQAEKDKKDCNTPMASGIKKDSSQIPSQKTNHAPSLQRTSSGSISQEVKQKLQEFVLKKQRDAAQNGGNRHAWAQRQQMSLDQSSPPPLNGRPGHGTVPGKSDFPLRKTASEPNLKVRSVLKQKVMNRSSPLLLRRRGEKLIRRRTPLSLDSQSHVSSEGSPPSAASTSLQSSLGSSNGTPISEEVAMASALFQAACPPPAGSQILEHGLYSSPSMPNISLGRPSGNQQPAIIDGKMFSSMSEAQLRAMAAARFGLPLVSHHHVLQPISGFCSQLPVIDGDVTPPTSPVFVQGQMRSLEQQGGAAGVPSTSFDASQARLQRSILRPLGRTQSAPLPLGHPLLQTAAGMTLQQQQHQLLKQHIRQTVLTRAGSKSNVLGLVPEQSSVVEEAEEMNQDEDEEVDILRTSMPNSGGEEMRTGDIASEQKQQPSVIQRQRLCSESSSRQQLRRLSRTLSSPLVSLERSSSSQSSTQDNQQCSPLLSNPQATALVYDSVMLKHQCLCGNFAQHPEHAGRLQSVWARLQETGLVQRCLRLRSRKASLEELQLAHSEGYTLLLGTNPLTRQKLELQELELPYKSFLMLSCGGIGVDSDTTWNEIHTASAARMAAGCVIELACKVAAGDVKNGFAVVRPPGHHAERQQAMGFCFFNSLAVAAKKVQQRFNFERILIVDWDVHHGNGIQQIFYHDPRVLYISLHRHDDGNFFPGTGSPHEIGEDEGRGFNVNIAWSGGLNPPMGDAEYLAAFRTIVMPIAKEYQPQLVMVACGFDAAKGHAAPLGGYSVSPACFGLMTRQLMTICNGKLVLALEGGYDLPSVCDCSEAVTRALLGEEACSKVAESELARKPTASAIENLKRVAVIQAPYWPCTKQWAATIGCSSLEAMQLTKDSEDTVNAMALLSVARQSSPDNKVEEPMDQDK